ncbi:MAG: YceD family protein [Burkholderiales bacterium]
MSEQVLIDGLKFASEGRRCAGELALAAMPRLQDSIFEPAGRVHYALIGMTDRHGQPIIEVSVRGTVPLQCRRCLERLDYVLDRTSRLAPVAPGAQLPDVAEEDPDTEAIAAAEVANVADLIEQEVLLGLPLAPVHDGPCTPAQGPAAAKVESPFAVLRTLKQKQE